MSKFKVGDKVICYPHGDRSINTASGIIVGNTTGVYIKVKMNKDSCYQGHQYTDTTEWFVNFLELATKLHEVLS